jgi:hypothetical protein
MRPHKLREQMKLPHVRAYAMNERRVLLDALIAGNPAALKEIRDKSENSTARVAAIKTAEALREMADDPRSSGMSLRQTPGFVIVIQHADGTVREIGPPPPPPMQIEGEAEPAELEPPERSF